MRHEHILALRGKFPSDQYALLDEVRDAAGFEARRSCDIMAFGLWPSRGHELHGIEVKSGRGDWLKELKTPKKQESIFQFCDRFWLFATNETVVLKETEIPKNWGYLLQKGDRVYVKKEAPVLKPKVLNKTFTAALIKRAVSRMIHPSDVQGKIDSAVASAKQNAIFESERKMNSLKNLEEAVKEFEEITGLSLIGHRSWVNFDPKKFGTAVKLILKHQEKTDWYYDSLKKMNKHILNVSKSVEELLQEGADLEPQSGKIKHEAL